MRFADHSVGRPFAKDPAVVRFKGKYWLYYSKKQPTPAGVPPIASLHGERFVIGIAAGRDLETWDICGEIVPVQPCETESIAAPGAIVVDNRLHLFYQQYGPGGYDNMTICHAVSDDGLHFQRDPGNPIFRPTVAGMTTLAIDADVIAHDGQLWLFYSGRDAAADKHQVPGLARRPLADLQGESAGRLDPAGWDEPCNGPLLVPEEPWEGQCLEASAVCRHDGKFWLFYGGNWCTRPQQIGLAVSDDGLNWRRASREPILPAGLAGSWNADESGHPYVFVDDDGTTHLMYQGTADKGRTYWLSRKIVRWGTPLPTLIEPTSAATRS